MGNLWPNWALPAATSIAWQLAHSIGNADQPLKPLAHDSFCSGVLCTGIERIWWRFGHILEARCIADVEGWVFDIRSPSGRARDRVTLGAMLQRSKPRS